jgi:hypothetical protein
MSRPRRRVVLLHGWVWAQLAVKLKLYGPDRRDFYVHRAEAPSDWPHVDLEPDVRELVLASLSLQYDRVAMWSDPLEQLGVSGVSAPTRRRA